MYSGTNLAGKSTLLVRYDHPCQPMGRGLRGFGVVPNIPRWGNPDSGLGNAPQIVSSGKCPNSS